MSLVNIANVCSHLQNASRVRLGLTSVPATKFNVALMLGLQKQGFLSSVTLGGQAPPLSFAMRTPEQLSEAEQASEVLQENPWMAYPTLDENRRKKLLAKFKQYTKKQEEASASASTSEITSSPDEIDPDISLQETEINTHLKAGKVLNPAADLPQDPNHKIQADLPPLLRESIVPQNPAQRRLWLGLKYWKSEPVLSKMKMISTPRKRITAKADDLRKISLGANRNEIRGIVNPGECIFVLTDQGCLEIREAISRRRGGLVLCRVS